MSFTVTARLSARRFAYHHASILNALDQGMSLIAAGMADVRIIDGDGRTWGPAALYGHMFEGETGIARTSKVKTAGVALAA